MICNSGKLEILFLGVGSAFSVKNNQTNFLIIKGDKHILVDFGMTGPKALNQHGIDLFDITTVLPTHSHADHIGGIECLSLMNRYVGVPFKKKEKLKMIITEEYQRILWENSLRGGLEYNEESQGKRLNLVDYFNVVRPQWKAHQPREIFEIKYEGIKLEIFRTKHVPEQSVAWQDSFISYGLFIDDSVFVSCDTRFDRDLIDLYAAKSDVMFHDVQFFPGAVHAPLADLKELPYYIKEKMILIHYADDYEKHDVSDFKGYAKEGYRYSF
jgi:ribonuclease BN (tRNA processing enzyme)